MELTILIAAVIVVALVGNVESDGPDGYGTSTLVLDMEIKKTSRQRK